MKRKVLFAGALFLTLGVIGLLGQQDPPAFSQGPNGAVLTGIWYWQNAFGPGVLPSVMTFHNDGTAMVSDGITFGGLPLAMNPFTVTPFYGVWKHTGPHKFTATFLALLFDRVTGILAGIVRTRAQFAFLEDFKHIAGTMRLDALLSDQTSPLFPLNCPDPLAPDAIWVPFGPGELSFHAARIKCVPY